jgi:hypothetical protein
LLVLCGALLVGASTATGGIAGASAISTYEKKADAICRAYQSSNQQIPSSASATKALQMFSQNISNLSTGIRKLEALPRPKKEASALSTAYASADSLVALSNKAYNALKEGNESELNSLSAKLTRESKALNSKFQSLGLRTCSTVTCRSSAADSHT